MGIRTRNTNRKEIKMKKKRCKTVVESIEKDKIIVTKKFLKY